MKPCTRFLLTIGLIISLYVAFQASPKNVRAAGVFYVSPAPTGNDGNPCTTPSSPCATIQGALGKAAAGDTIKVAIGTYTATTDQVVLIEKAITLEGGWDSSFTTQSGMSTIDGDNTRRVVEVSSGTTASLNYFIIEHGTLGVYNFGQLTLDHSIVRNNHAGDYCWGSGIANIAGTVIIRWSTISDNDCSYLGYGGGIYIGQDATSVKIYNSVIHHNTAATGGGIYNRKSLIIVNSTISSNTAVSGASNSGGGGIFNDNGSVELWNVTIAGNDGANSGGGIYFTNTYGGYVTLHNSILANNIANYGSDCSGAIGSAGYNLIGDSSGCTFNSTTGDQVDIDPSIGSLQDNGGPTLTHWLYAGSPAIDGGKPAGCVDDLGAPLNIDQRGYPRPLDGNGDSNAICDIGAYEADPANLPPPPPQSQWYVTPQGDDLNDCHTSVTPCATINGALGKASSDDTIYISMGVYTTTNTTEVVLIDKDIKLLGGWDLGFSIQDSYSEIDGEYYRQGITIQNELIVKMERLYIDHCKAPVGIRGGGIYIGMRDQVTLSDSILSDNYALDGGGIYASGVGKLILNNSLVSYNQAFQDGGGIYHYMAPLTLNNSAVIGNIANSDGSGIGGWADVVLNDSQVSYNGSANMDRGGGIYNEGGNVTLNRSVVNGNIAGGEGGAIWGNYITLDHSALVGNQAKGGGGIYVIIGEVSIMNSLILGNKASENGGGIQDNYTILMTNSSVLGNQAGNDGGGIYGYDINASNTTFAENVALHSGGGMNGGGTFRNTILARNQAPSGRDCAGTVTSNGYNLFGNTSGCTIISNAGDILDVDPHFAHLCGWPLVLTFWRDSPAIDGGNPAGCVDHLGNPLTTDQLGAIRPVDGTGDGNAICDTGAYEYDPSHQPQWLFLPVITK